MKILKILIKNEPIQEELYGEAEYEVACEATCETTCEATCASLEKAVEEIVIAEHVEHANTFFTRLRGLLGRDGLPEGHGLLLSPCAAIHCSGMKFTIDAVFLDGEFRVLRVAQHLAPGGKAAQKGAKHVLELQAGRAAAAGLAVGQQLIVE